MAGKIEIIDDCLAPSQFIYLSYSGANPFKVYTKIVSLLQPFFEISSSGVFEDRFDWDVSGDDVGFFSKMKIRRDFGAFSNMFVHMWVRGSRRKDTNKGKFTLRVNSYVQTIFKYSNPITQALWNVYRFLFYDRRRREYIEFCRQQTYDFVDEIKKHFNLKIPEKVEWNE